MTPAPGLRKQHLFHLFLQPDGWVLASQLLILEMTHLPRVFLQFLQHLCDEFPVFDTLPLITLVWILFSWMNSGDTKERHLFSSPVSIMRISLIWAWSVFAPLFFPHLRLWCEESDYNFGRITGPIGSALLLLSGVSLPREYSVSLQ